MQHGGALHRIAAAALTLLVAGVVAANDRPAKPKPDFKPFEEVAEGYEKVVSTTDGEKPLYALYLDKKRNQLLAELPSGWAGQKYLIAATQAGGSRFAGLQGPMRYVYWKRYDKRLALIEPQIEVRSKGEPQSKDSVKRLFTDRVILDVPIVAMGESGQPVIDLDDLLAGKAGELLGSGSRRSRSPGGFNTRLMRVTKAKAFPHNVEVAIEAPSSTGTLTTLHYSISRVPKSTGYKPRAADERVGYFMTWYSDLGQYDPEQKWVRYIDRWHLEKRDPKLTLSPPKEPIVFYLEHTVPVRYRRWIRQGVEYWNEAFERVGLDGAIQVRYQDKATNAHMDKDPEDVRYNFIRWLNNDISTAIGPHRAHPITGQILDADVVLTDGWIRAYWRWFYEQAPELAIESFSAETLRWLEDHPDWDPRILLSSPEERARILARRAARDRLVAAGEELPPMPTDPALLMRPELAEMGAWIDDDGQHCLAAHGLAFDMAFGRMFLEAMDLVDAADAPPGDTLDGIPEWFVGPFLAELAAHEVGHTLGLRHNFKSSSIYTLEQINSDEWKGKKPLAGSVMDYLPPNFNMESGELQGDFTMIGVGPYDTWAIEYGYTFDDPQEVLKRVAEPELAYLTDDDTSGPDPLARRYDFSADPLAYAGNQMRIVHDQRAKVLDKFVKDGKSWSNARRGYSVTLSMQVRMLSMMANWIGGAYNHRDRKGDPNGRRPVEVTEPEKQRAALAWVVEHAFDDAAFGLTPELLAHMTVDKWSDGSRGDRGDATWEVHDNVMAVQSSVLTMVMNPTTLRRVHDNEFRTPTGEDALTLPELMTTVTGAVYADLDAGRLDGSTFTNRQPMVSSLRRNLQSSLTDRLISLSAGDRSMPRAIRTLAAHHLRRLSARLDALADKAGGGQIDAYTVAHVEDLKDRVSKALERMYVEQM